MFVWMTTCTRCKRSVLQNSSHACVPYDPKHVSHVREQRTFVQRKETD